MSSNSNSTRSSDGKAKANKGKSRKEEEQVEVPKVLDYLFEKELINKQNKHIHLMDIFGPSRKSEYCHRIYKFVTLLDSACQRLKKLINRVKRFLKTYHVNYDFS